MSFDHLGMTRGLQRRALASLAAQVDDIGLKHLLKIQRMQFQFFDVEEHRENLRGDRAVLARGSTPRGVSTARSKT
jgi:hypothetical protein